MLFLVATNSQHGYLQQIKWNILTGIKVRKLVDRFVILPLFDLHKLPNVEDNPSVSVRKRDANHMNIE